MSDQDVDDFLEHFGVKGMKWGVRRTRSRPDNIPSQFMLRRGEKKKRLILGEKKVESLFDSSLNDPDVLINPNGQTAATGKKFSKSLLTGALLAVSAASIYNQQQKRDEETSDETEDEILDETGGDE